jgi:type II secretory pathway pseudopilin PulG
MMHTSGLDSLSRRAAMTLVEMLVVIALVALLCGLLLPAVQAARESARATVCRNHLRQVALATSLFESTQRSFPPARFAGWPDDPAPVDPGPTWVLRLLPWLDEGPAADAWEPGQPYGSQPDAIHQLVVPTLLCPTRRSPATALLPTAELPPLVAPCGCLFPSRQMAGGGLTDFAGNHGDLTPGSGDPDGDFTMGGNGSGTIISIRSLPGTLSWRDWVRAKDVSDGISRTLLAGELHVRRSLVLRPPDCGPALDGSSFHHITRAGGPGGPLASGPDDDVGGMASVVFGSWHPEVCHVAYADGRVVGLSPAVDPIILGRLCNRRDGHATHE